MGKIENPVTISQFIQKWGHGNFPSPVCLEMEKDLAEVVSRVGEGGAKAEAAVTRRTIRKSTARPVKPADDE